MKLDSIVYDYGSLREALAKTLNDESPTFKAIYPSDTATSLVNVLASYGSMLEYQLVSAMANMYTDSAYSEAGIYQLAETLGNRIHGNISSEIYCTIERTNLRGVPNVHIPAGSNFIIGALNFFNPKGITFSMNGDILEDIRLIQGTLQTAEFITAGISGERFYFCDDFKCNTNLVKVYVNDTQWGITDSFLPYVITDTSVEAESQVVIVRTDPSGRTYVKVGNNTNGMIPSKGSTIRVEYISNEGANGNLDNNQVEIELNTPIYHTLTNGTRVRLEVDIKATTTAFGGFNTQSLDVLRESSPYTFGSGQRAVRRNDYKTMLLNQCGYLTCNVWGEYEEAAINGGYDKIMMNMVYYTGIKSIQKYDLQPVTTINISMSELQNAEIKYYTTHGSVRSARGFLGSYIINISSVTSDNYPISVKYRDANGNNILTCDPSINNLNSVNDFDKELYPVNDLSWESHENGDFGIQTSQMPRLDSNDPNRLIVGNPEGEYGISSGVDYNSQATIVNWDNPFQIRLNYTKPVSIAAFSLKNSEGSNCTHFPHKLAVYGTNESINDETGIRWYDNIKNNSKWTKLTGIQTIDNTIAENSFCDWITTNVYNPGSSTTVDETINTGWYDPMDETNTGQRLSSNSFILKKVIGDDYSYSVKLDGITQSSDTYIISADNILTFADVVPDNVTIVVYGTLNDWASYKHYVIEVYEIQDSSIKNPSTVALKQIKAIYKDSASTIDYTHNNTIALKIPITTVEGLKYVYTRPFKEPLTANPEPNNPSKETDNWLKKEPYAHIADNDLLNPDMESIYFVRDYYSRLSAVELVSGGAEFVEGEEITVPFYKLAQMTDTGNEQGGILNNNSEAFEVGDTFTIDGGRKIYVKEVSATGKIMKVDWTEGFEYTGNPEYSNPDGKIALIDSGSYSGNGKEYLSMRFVIKSEETITNQDNQLKIKVLSVDGNGAITEFVTIPEDSITRYDPAGDGIRLTPLNQIGTAKQAVINVTTDRVVDYDSKCYVYVQKHEPNPEDPGEMIITKSYFTEKIMNMKTICLPETMMFYEYEVELKGITEANGYKTNDILTFSTILDNYTYVFQVKVNNLASGVYTTTLQMNTSYPTTVLKGKSPMNTVDTSLFGGSGAGATISISSKSILKVTASYTGNYYTNVDIQAFDLPILNNYNHFTTYIEFKQPKIKNVLIEVNVEYENISTYQTVKANLVKAINEMFDLKPFSIGKKLNVSDIWKTIGKIEGINRFIVITPVDNIDCMPYELINLPAENLIINDIINSENK